MIAAGERDEKILERLQRCGNCSGDAFADSGSIDYWHRGGLLSNFHGEKRYA